jgi:hypothetical protein
MIALPPEELADLAGDRQRMIDLNLAVLPYLTPEAIPHLREAAAGLRGADLINAGPWRHGLPAVVTRFGRQRHRSHYRLHRPPASKRSHQPDRDTPARQAL